RAATDHAPPFCGHARGRNQKRPRVAPREPVRDDQGHLTPPKARADPMKPPAAVLARGPDSEQLDHGAHDPRGSLRIDDGNMKIAWLMRLSGLLQELRAVGRAPRVAPAI